MNITFVGLGLIGGSLALSLRKEGFATKLLGVDISLAHQQFALERGLVDEVLPLPEALSQSDLVIVSIPVNATSDLLPTILDSVQPHTVVVDMGSTKAQICRVCANHPNRSQFVASHPIAGTEHSGPQAATAGLFNGKKTIICEAELSAPFALQRVLDMYKCLGMEVVYMNPEVHDRHIAFVSHLSHISSFALGLTVLDIEKDEKSIFDMAGSGFSSTVRLAKSSPDMWTPIFIQNAESLSYALGAYIEKLVEFKESIECRDAESLHSLMQQANDIRRIVK